MPLFSGLSFLRREGGGTTRPERADDAEDFSDLEKDFFAQGENAEAMKRSPEERMSDLTIAEWERKQGHLERKVLAHGDIEDMVNTFKRTGNLDDVNQTPEVKIAFLRNMADQLEAKKRALKTLDTVPLDSIRRIDAEISTLEDLQVKYGMEIDFDGGPDGGEELTLDFDEEDEESLAA